MIPAPFDALAPAYDAAFTASPVARLLRARVHARLAACFPRGARVLELGGGTGEDALFLARAGARVVTTDASGGMRTAARAKTAGEPGVTVLPLDLNRLPEHDADPALDGPFDGTFANFGVLNAVADWPALARWLAGRVRPGGAAAFGVMAPYCLWETAWHALHGDARTAFRRWRGTASFQPAPGVAPLTIRYPTPRQLARAFAPWFRPTRVHPLGLLLPPSDAYPVVERRPRLLRLLAALDARLDGAALLAPLADHFWIELARR